MVDIRRFWTCRIGNTTTSKIRYSPVREIFDNILLKFCKGILKSPKRTTGEFSLLWLLYHFSISEKHLNELQAICIEENNIANRTFLIPKLSQANWYNVIVLSIFSSIWARIMNTGILEFAKCLVKIEGEFPLVRNLLLPVSWRNIHTGLNYRI